MQNHARAPFRGNSKAFRAPVNIFDSCDDCGLAILPREIIVEQGSGYMHLDCLEARMEDANENRD